MDHVSRKNPSPSEETIKEVQKLLGHLSFSNSQPGPDTDRMTTFPGAAHRINREALQAATPSMLRIAARQGMLADCGTTVALICNLMVIASHFGVIREHQEGDELHYYGIPSIDEKFKGSVLA